MEEKVGIVTEIIYRNEENGYTVADFETEEEYFTIVGQLPHVTKGTRFRLVGTFKNHKTYGEQFAFTEFEEILPEGARAIYDFLCSGIIRGIGPKVAAAIIEKFGDDTLEVIETEPDKLTSVKGVGKKTAQTIYESFLYHRQFALVSMEFQRYGLTTAQSMRLYKSYGAEALGLIQENPYRLVQEVRGFGFRKADEIAEKMGIDRDSPFRVEAGITYALWYYVGEGSTYVPKAELIEKVGELLDVSAELVKDSLVMMVFEGKVKIENLDGEEAVYLYPYFVAEQNVVRNLLRISSGRIKPLTTNVENMIAAAEVEQNIALSNNQKEAVVQCVDHGISVITGGPGTGKTTIISALIRIFERSELKVAIAAPTGRAAKRITETTGHFAQTVHRLLEYYYSDETDDMRFGKNGEDRLEYDVIIVDEASMIDLMLMQGLTEAVGRGARLLFIGDFDQLPSVGAGNVLRDLIDSGFVHTTRLTEIFRQAEESYIIVNSHRINHGEYPYLNEREKDFFFMERNSEMDIANLIEDVVTTRLPSYYGYDAMRDIQVITPMHKGMLGTKALNDALQNALNPKDPSKAEKVNGDRIFREGDKVMQTRNNYQIGWKKRRDFTEGQGIFNGDEGYIQRIDNENGEMTVVFDDEKYVTYRFEDLNELELAYAITVHKSQGSEFPVVVMPISWFPPMLATRNLLYTAVTRGKKLVVLCGMQHRMEAMIDNNRISLRYSGLKYRLAAVLMELERSGEQISL